MLVNRAQRVLKNTDHESNRTLGLEIPALTGRVLGSASSMNVDGIRDADCGLAVVGTAVMLDSMKALGESSTRRGGTPTEKINAGLSSLAGD